MSRDAQGRFLPGHSGNNLGKPRGARNRATVAAEELTLDHLDRLVRACIVHAARGDATMMRVLLERVWPKRSAAIEIDLPPIRTAADVTRSMSQIVLALGEGRLSVAEAEAATRVVEALGRSIALTEQEARIEALEKAAGLRVVS